MGLKPVKNTIQIESIDDDLRTSLWNVMHESYWDFMSPSLPFEPLYQYDWLAHNEFYYFCKKIWCDFLKQSLNDFPKDIPKFIQLLRYYYNNYKWNEVYDCIEFIASNYPDSEKNKNFIEGCNEVLKKELSAYRFVGGVITRITTETEIKEIEEAIERTDSMKPVHEHLVTSLKYLSDRKTPNYRNSIKESISAVEAICNLINGKKLSLGKTLDIIDDKIRMHPVLKIALDKLYGWTSDADGIRHAMMEEPNLDFEDAKFMLMSCSAFINYLIVKAQKAGVENF